MPGPERRLIAAPGETLALVLAEGHLQELRVLRDRAFCPHPWPGDVCDVRVAQLLPQRAILDLGGGAGAMLEPAPPVPEGARVRVRIVHPGTPGLRCGKLPKAVLAQPETALHRVDPVAHWLALRPEAGPVTAQAWSGAAAEALSRAGVAGPIAIGLDPVRGAALDAALEALLDPVQAFPGGSLAVARTPIGWVADVNGEGRPLDLNRAAAAAIARIVQRAGIAGSATIDFVSMANKAERQAVADAFDAASASDPRPYERTAINGFGQMQLVRARREPSTLDVLAPDPAEGLSADSQALLLLRAALRSRGVGPRTLSAAPAVIARLQALAACGLLADVERQLGAALLLAPSCAQPARETPARHVHVQPA